MFHLLLLFHFTAPLKVFIKVNPCCCTSKEILPKHSTVYLLVNSFVAKLCVEKKQLFLYLGLLLLLWRFLNFTKQLKFLSFSFVIALTWWIEHFDSVLRNMRRGQWGRRAHHRCVAEMNNRVHRLKAELSSTPPPSHNLINSVQRQGSAAQIN